MTETAMIFPGQGSQAVGTLADLAVARDCVQRTFEQASKALRHDLWALVNQGPESDAAVEEICAEIPDHPMVPANYNSTGQLVVAGTCKAIEQAAVRSRETGARLAMMLPDGAPAHSTRVASDPSRLEEAATGIEIRVPEWPAPHNADLSVHDEAAEIRAPRNP